MLSIHKLQSIAIIGALHVISSIICTRNILIFPEHA